MGLWSLFYNKHIYDISKSCVRIQNQVSDAHVGAKHGDNWNPNLFKIFINDLPHYLSDTPDSVTVNGEGLHAEISYYC